jgi:ligand-binding sensor domain-containing protein
MIINKIQTNIIFASFIFIFIISYISKSEDSEWINFTNSDDITCVEVYDNKLFVGSTGGLSIIDLENDEIIYINHANSGIPDNSITAIAFENNGTIWIGTEKAGVARFNGTEWIIYRKENSILPDNNIKALAIDKDNNIWIGTSNGILTRNKDNSWKILNQNNSPLPNNKVKRIMLGEDDNIYIASEGGLSIFDGSNWTLYNSDNIGLPIEDCYLLCEYF